MPTVARWRARAQEARDLAETLLDLTAKQQMLEIAEQYDTLIRDEDKLAAVKRAFGSTNADSDPLTGDVPSAV